MFLLHIFPLNMFYASHNLDATENCVPLNNKKKKQKKTQKKQPIALGLHLFCVSG